MTAAVALCVLRQSLHLVLLLEVRYLLLNMKEVTSATRNPQIPNPLQKEKGWQGQKRNPYLTLAELPQIVYLPVSAVQPM